LGVALGPKRLELLQELVPRATVIGVLLNPSNRIAELQMLELQEAARSLRLKLIVLTASTERELDSAFATLAQQRVGALLVVNDPWFINERKRLVTLAAHHAVPTSFSDQADAVAGGLMSYGASIADSFRQAGVYVGRILKGEKPADLPVVQPTKFELIINLKTTKALGLTCRTSCSSPPTR
jgi:putative tryptophan/tyrosine transport system substrate-binding protein